VTRAPKADGRECVLNTPRPATSPQLACESAPGPADPRARAGVRAGRLPRHARQPLPGARALARPLARLRPARCGHRRRRAVRAPAQKSQARGAAPARRARYGPRLSAANYRYIVRGRSEKAAADDVRVAARRRARLAPYDRDLRQFRRGSPLA